MRRFCKYCAGICLIMFWGLLCAESSLAAETIGVIEIGAKGIKKISCEVTPNGFVWTNKEDFNADIASTWKGDKFDEQPFEEALRGISDFAVSLEKGGVPRNRIYAVVSSGAAQILTEKSGGDSGVAVSELRKALVGKGIGALNIEFLTVDVEAALNYTDAVGAQDGKAVAFDVGSGNSKVAIGDGIPDSIEQIKTWDIGPGTKRLGDDRNESKLDVRQELIRQHSKIFYLSGGIGYVVASWAKPREFGVATAREEFLTITLEDIKQFRELLLTSSDKLFDAKLRQLEDAQNGDATAAKNLLRAKGIFDAKQLDAGSWLLFTIFSKVSNENKEIEIRVVRDGQYSVAKGWAKQKSVKLFGPRIGALIQGPIKEMTTAIESLKKASEQKSGGDVVIAVEELRKSSVVNNEATLARIASLEKSLLSLEKFAESSAATALRQETLLREILAELKRNRSGTVQSLPRDRESAMIAFFEAVQLRKQGRLDVAQLKLDEAISHSVMESDVWLLRAIIAKELGDENTARQSIALAASLIESGKFSASKISQSLERVQGASRELAETELMTERTHFASTQNRLGLKR